MIVSHLPVYNYVWTILLYFQASALYYCYCAAKVRARYGWIYRDESPKVYWVIIGILGSCIGCFATGVVLVNCFAYGRSIVFYITSVAAGLALIATYGIIAPFSPLDWLPGSNLKDLARSLAVTVSLGLIAALLLAAARNFGP
jgi:hypothetical protein